MFTAHTEWMEYPCFYVSAFEGISRITLLAGPYRTTEQAEFAVDAARTLGFTGERRPTRSFVQL